MTYTSAAEFLLGGGGIAVLFRRWRQNGDRLAQILCLSAFGLWSSAVAVGTVTKDQAQVAAAGLADSALVIGLVGAIAVVVRDKRLAKADDKIGTTDDTAPPDV